MRNLLLAPPPGEYLHGRNDPMPVREAHAVLGTPLRGPWPDGMETLLVGMGCFWGAERLFWEVPGVYTTAVGYAGGHTTNPTYDQTCTSLTGHAETVLVVFDPAVVTLEDLLTVFWENHDPTRYVGLGHDVGSQYRSAIYANSDSQLAAIEASRERYQATLDDAGSGAIRTEVAPAGEFFYAEDDHQQYLAPNPRGYGNGGSCQIRPKDPNGSDDAVRTHDTRSTS